jgi:hypothetical protein
MKNIDLTVSEGKDFESIEGFVKEALAVLEYYDVAHVPHIPYDGKDERVIAGVCDPQRRLILLNDEVCNMEMRRTIIHELIHARDFIVDGRSTEKSTGKRTAYLFEPIYGK